jgi:hypothetical protein
MTRVTVECVGCKRRKDIGPGEVSGIGVPMCDHCYMPMVAVSALVRTEAMRPRDRARAAQIKRGGRGR